MLLDLQVSAKKLRVDLVIVRPEAPLVGDRLVPLPTYSSAVFYLETYESQSLVFSFPMLESKDPC